MATKEDKEFYGMLWRNGIGNTGCGTPLYIAVVIGFLFLLFSCKTIEDVNYVDREVVRYEVRVQHDTLIQNVHDSVFHSIIQNGDTIFDVKYYEKVKYRDKVIVQIDTLWRDSIQTQIKETTVEKQIIPKWCYYCLSFSVLLVIFAIIKFVRWIQIH